MDGRKTVSICIIAYISSEPLRRYSKFQVAAVAMVTCGVSATAYSAMHKNEMMASSSNFEYSIGILVLAVALILSGLMGLEQDRVYGQYGRGHWEEALFYLHAMALPMFAFTWTEISQELQVASLASSAAPDTVWLPHFLMPPELAYIYAKWFPTPVALSAFTSALSLIVLTQLFCIVGVHRLTSRVDSLSVSLVLATRKALSLTFSVLLLNGSWGNMWMWAGATWVLLGSIAYSLSSSTKARQKTD
jgi:UDP-xylose/UDP-N-acetylglucosamine transporter B4